MLSVEDRERIRRACFVEDKGILRIPVERGHRFRY